VFCKEKSCLPAFTPGTPELSLERSTEKESERTSALKSEFTFGSAFPNLTMAGYTPGLAKMFLSAQLARRFRGAESGAEIFGRYVTSYSSGGSAWDREDFPEQRRDVMRANGRALFADLASGDGRHVPRDRLRAISCPVTLAVTELSPSFLQKAARGLREVLPDHHRFEVIPGAGHALSFDQPGELERVIREASAVQVGPT